MGGGAGRVLAPLPVLSAGKAHRCWCQLVVRAVEVPQAGCALRTFLFQPVACQEVVGFCLAIWVYAGVIIVSHRCYRNREKESHSWLCSIEACNMTMMLMGRVIAGFSVGLLSGNAPVYTSEIAPPKLRGALVTGFQFAITAAWLSLKFAKAVDVVLGHCHDDCFDMFACRIILHNSMPQSGVFCKVGIMLAFLLALVLEDVEKPYGGWRWVIAAQILD